MCKNIFTKIEHIYLIFCKYMYYLNLKSKNVEKTHGNVIKWEGDS